MLSLKATLKAIGESITTIKSALDGKASREWTLVYSGTGGSYANLSTSGYKEALVVCYTSYGTHAIILPVSYLTASKKEVYLTGGGGYNVCGRDVAIQWSLTSIEYAVYVYDGNKLTTVNYRLYAR